MKGRSKLVVALAVSAVGGFIYSAWQWVPAVTQFPVYCLVPTNAPVLNIPEGYPSVPTDNWRVEVPYESTTNKMVSLDEIVMIKRLGIFHHWWWPQRIESITIESPETVTIEYPTRSPEQVHELVLVKEQGEWKVSRERKRTLRHSVSE